MTMPGPSSDYRFTPPNAVPADSDKESDASFSPPLLNRKASSKRSAELQQDAISALRTARTGNGKGSPRTSQARILGGLPPKTLAVPINGSPGSPPSNLSGINESGLRSNPGIASATQQGSPGTPNSGSSLFSKSRGTSQQEHDSQLLQQRSPQTTSAPSSPQVPIAQIAQRVPTDETKGSKSTSTTISCPCCLL